MAHSQDAEPPGLFEATEQAFRMLMEADPRTVDGEVDEAFLHHFLGEQPDPGGFERTISDLPEASVRFMSALMKIAASYMSKEGLSQEGDYNVYTSDDHPWTMTLFTREKDPKAEHFLTSLGIICDKITDPESWEPADWGLEHSGGMRIELYNISSFLALKTLLEYHGLKQIDEYAPGKNKHYVVDERDSKHGNYTVRAPREHVEAILAKEARREEHGIVPVIQGILARKPSFFVIAERCLNQLSDKKRLVQAHLINNQNIPENLFYVKHMEIPEEIPPDSRTGLLTLLNYSPVSPSRMYGTSNVGAPLEISETGELHFCCATPENSVSHNISHIIGQGPPHHLLVTCTYRDLIEDIPVDDMLRVMRTVKNLVFSTDRSFTDSATKRLGNININCMLPNKVLADVFEGMLRYHGMKEGEGYTKTLKPIAPGGQDVTIFTLDKKRFEEIKKLEGIGIGRRGMGGGDSRNYPLSPLPRL